MSTTCSKWRVALHVTQFGVYIIRQSLICTSLICFSKIFEPYAKFWLNPLMELTLQMKEKEQPGTEGINYFIVDLVVTMLSWSSTAIPEVSWCWQIQTKEIF